MLRLGGRESGLTPREHSSDARLLTTIAPTAFSANFKHWYWQKDSLCSVSFCFHEGAGMWKFEERAFSISVPSLTLLWAGAMTCLPWVRQQELSASPRLLPLQNYPLLSLSSVHFSSLPSLWSDQVGYVEGGLRLSSIHAGDWCGIKTASSCKAAFSNQLDDWHGFSLCFKPMSISQLVLLWEG